MKFREETFNLVGYFGGGSRVQKLISTGLPATKKTGMIRNEINRKNE